MSERREVGPRSREIVAREQQHIAPGPQSFALYSGLAMARGQGSTLVDEDGNEYIDFIAGIGVGSVGHCHPHYVEALKRQAERLDVRQLHHRDARPLSPPARLRHAGGADAHPALLGRRRGGGGGPAAGPGQERQERDHRLLGRLPRQDGGRARPAGQRFQAPPRPVPARPAPHPVRATATAARCSSSTPMRHRLRGLRARRDPQPDRRRDRRHHRRADPGHGGQHRAAARLSARRPGDRQGARGAAARRRDDHGIGTDRADVGSRARRRRSRHHDGRQGHRRRIPAERRRSPATRHGGQAVVESELQLVELRRQSAGRGGGARPSRSSSRKIS